MPTGERRGVFMYKYQANITGEFWGKVKSALGGKVDKQKGKTLSTNDYTEEDKQKVENLKPISKEEIESLF